MNDFITKYLAPFLGGSSVFCGLMVYRFGWDTVMASGLVQWIMGGLGGAAITTVLALALTFVVKLTMPSNDFAKTWMIFFTINVFVLGLTYVISVPSTSG